MTGIRPVFISYSSDDLDRVTALVRYKWADHAERLMDEATKCCCADDASKAGGR